MSVSGVVTTVEISLVDSDTNDPLQSGRASNDTAATAQVAANPAIVVGYVNLPNVGPPGANFASGDRWDIYRVDLVAGQTIELNFADASSADLDLYVADVSGNLLGQSTGLTRSECVRVTRTATYSVVVNAFAGASTYELSWGPPRNSSCGAVASSAGAQFVPGQLIAKPKVEDGVVAAAATRALTDGRMRSKSAPQSSVPMLVELASTAEQRVRGQRALATRAGKTTHQADESASPAGVPAEAMLAYETVVAAKLLRQSGGFDYVDLNAYATEQQTAVGAWPPNDPDLARQPHLGLIRLPQAFSSIANLTPPLSYTPIVAVVDSGIVANHPDLARMLVAGFDFVSDPASGGDGDGIDPIPDDARLPTGSQAVSFHGTHVAGTIAAETFNGIGGAGVAPMARVMPVRVLGVAGRGTTFDIVQGILFAAGAPNVSGFVPARRADVINLSLGGAGGCPSVFADAITQARSRGAVVVAAAGNEAAPVSSPANCPGAIAVSAMSFDGSVAYYSNTGAQVAVTAPGGNVRSFSPAGIDLIHSTYASFVTNSVGVRVRQPNYYGSQGTSMAAPHVAGVVALMRAVNPAITPAAVDALLANGSLTRDLGTPGRDPLFGYGLIDAAKAVEAAAASVGSTIATPATLDISPPLLDFGSMLTELPIAIRQINGSTDTPASFTSTAVDPALISIPAGPPSGTAGTFNYIVRIDRARLVPGENAVRLTIQSAQGRSYPIDLVFAPRPVAPVGNRGVGTIYVLALNPETLVNAGQAIVSGSLTSYPYTVLGITVPRVVVAAGPDLDNDQYICGAGEPCGVYPVRSADPTIVETTTDRAGINFQMVSGGVSAASVGSASQSRGLPRR